MSCVSRRGSLSFRSTKKEPLQRTLQLEVPALQCRAEWWRCHTLSFEYWQKASEALPFYIHFVKTSKRHIGWFCGLGWAGLGWAALEFIWGRNIFLISLFKEREILDGSNILSKFYIFLRVNWCIPKTWVLQMDVVGESGLKQMYFLFKYNTMLKPLCMFA